MTTVTFDREGYAQALLEWSRTGCEGPVPEEEEFVREGEVVHREHDTVMPEEEGEWVEIDTGDLS